MKEVVNIIGYLDRKSENEPHEVAELMCIKCYFRYIGAYNSKTLLKDMICPDCGNSGGIIKTGQSLQEGDE